jgi:GLPGLI family protein
MKKILIALCMAFSLASGAQMKEGKIVYERTMQLPRRVFNSNNNNEMAAQLPATRTDQFELLFGNSQSLWQSIPDPNQEGQNTIDNGNGMVMMFRPGGLNDVIFHNFTTQTKTEQREIMDRNFVVTDSIRKLQWKLSEETKTILNYTVRKATAQRIGTRPMTTMENGVMKREEVADTANIVAWFTTDIPVPAGPGAEYQGQLPGMILEMDVNNGRTVFKAVEVSPKVSVSKIREPRDGKKVTAAEFTKERDKLMEEMRRNMPSGNMIRMQ